MRLPCGIGGKKRTRFSFVLYLTCHIGHAEEDGSSGMDTTSTPVEIFCSYAHEDETWLRKLETHLSLLKRQGLISFWHDRLITPGTDWAKAIDTQLETASVILLFISADFLASQYCYGIEMKRALERQEAGEALVIPILVRSVDWQTEPFARLQFLPTDAKPLATWSDTDTALADVAAGIRRAVEELPQLAASAPRAALPPVWNVPYPRNPFFLGRNDKLAWLRRQLPAGQATARSQPQAISGLGGIGKTQLALEYTYRYHQDYQAVLWVNAESTEALISSYVSIASLLRLPEREVQEQDLIVQAVKTWLQTHRSWLLILDNADELPLLPDFLPPSIGGHVLLTTRAVATGRLAHRLEIEALLPQQGALLLLRRATRIAPDAELSQADPEEAALALQISQELGGLPLALDQAGAYLEATGTNVAGYWQIYQHDRADLLQRRGGLATDDHPAPVTTTISLSVQKVQEKHAAAADLLLLLAFLAPDAIPGEILTTGASYLGLALAPVAADILLLNQAIEVLRAYSLVQRDPGEQTFSVHRLVQAVLQDTLSRAERCSWAERAMQAVNAAFPHAEQSTWAQCERLLPHALLVTHCIEADQIMSKEAGRLLYETASYLLDCARYAEARTLFQESLRIREQQPGPDHLEKAMTHRELGTAYREVGKFEEAKSHYQCALSLFENQLGSESLDVARVRANFATISYYLGNYEEAEHSFQHALPIFEKQVGPTHLTLAPLLTNQAECYRVQGRNAEAEQLHLRALSIWEQYHGREHPIAANTLNNLGILYKDWGNYTEAESYYLRAQHIWEQRLGAEHPHVGALCNNLAEMYKAQGRYKEAEQCGERALHIFEALGGEHPYVAASLSTLADLCSQQEKYEQAEQLYQRALHIWEQTPESQNLDWATALHNFARLREMQGHGEDARTMYAHALTVREQALGAHHPKTTETRKHLIALLRTLGQHEEAAQLEAIPPEL